MILLCFSLAASSSSSSSSSLDELMRPSEFYENFTIEFLNSSLLEKKKKIGSGRFSEVFDGSVSNETIVAIKELKPSERWRLNREVKILQLIQDIPQVIKIYGIYGDDHYPSIVTELGQSSRLRRMELDDLRWVGFELFSCLKKIHSRKIFHRDIKWGNTIVDFQQRVLKIIDWGLAEFEDSGIKFSTRVGTKSYKAPELLLNHKKYNHKIDIWSAGCIMANIIFGVPSFFAGSDNDAVLDRQSSFFGYKRITEIRKMLNSTEYVPYHAKQDYLEYALPHTRHLINRETIGILEAILEPNPMVRPNASDVLKLSFFKKDHKPYVIV